MGGLHLTVGYPSGQRGQTVNLLAYAFDGSNPSPTTTLKNQASIKLDYFLSACGGMPPKLFARISPGSIGRERIAFVDGGLAVSVLFGLAV